jgi:hypothetical protein
MAPVRPVMVRRALGARGEPSRRESPIVRGVLRDSEDAGRCVLLHDQSTPSQHPTVGPNRRSLTDQRFSSRSARCGRVS